MAYSTWKQREIDNRGKEYLRVARRILADKGYAGFSMDRLAEATEYSKGTLYQHFKSKDDVLVSIAIEMEEVRVGLLKRAAAFEGWTRERILAMGVAHEVLYRMYPDYSSIEDLTETAPFREKIAPERQASLDQVVGQSSGAGLAVIRDAVEEGDLSLPYGMTAEQVLLGLVAINKGLRAMWTARWWDRKWVPDVPSLHNHLLNTVCDGLGWKPFGSEWNYDATLKRIWEEVFAPEAQSLISI